MKEENNVTDLSKVIAYAESILGNDYTGHGFDHVKRVAGLSQAIIDADELAVDCFVVQAAAYLHDTVDDKVVADVTAASNEVRACLTTAGASEAQTKEIFSIIENLSFSKELLQGAQVVSVEGRVVRDADRLDALGAIGILRTSYFGGSHQHPIHVSDLAPKTFQNHEDYRKGTTVINHFYEKLFLLPEKMTTAYGKKEAQRRVAFMKDFLEEFYAEWDV